MSRTPLSDIGRHDPSSRQPFVRQERDITVTDVPQRLAAALSGDVIECEPGGGRALLRLPPDSSIPTMANRHADWFRQAEADLRHARNALEAGDHEWACFAAQQAAEKALKSVVQAEGGEAWGHSVTVLVGDVAQRIEVAEGLDDAGRRLDKHYIPTRYPNGFDAGAPTDYYTAGEAERAIADAESILEFCRGALG